LQNNLLGSVSCGQNLEPKPFSRILSWQKPLFHASPAVMIR
jgi:hypothetical protein